MFDEAQSELLAYTLAHRDSAFIHQYAVDAITAQGADETTKPIALTFALIGLYLHLERGLTGNQVQQMHQRLAARKHPWPSLPLPAVRGTLTVIDVLAQPPGPKRDQSIERWCADVWAAYAECRAPIIRLLAERGIT